MPDLGELGLHLIGGAIPDPKERGWYVFSKVRNESLRLPYFLRYYREMGSRLFVIVDNDSTDGSTEYLLEQADVLVLHTSHRFSESQSGSVWIDALLAEYGQNRWCLCVDVDELLVYPHCEQVPLEGLADHLTGSGANALPAFLLDMYAQTPIRDTHYKAGTPFLSACPHFDPAGYTLQVIGGKKSMPVRGGPRSRLFWDGFMRGRPAPYLLKLPLMRWSSGMQYTSSGHLLANAILSEVTGALLHFKLFSDFPGRSQAEALREEHYDGASEYRAYSEAVLAHPDLGAWHSGSARYRDSMQLVEMGLMYSSPAFDKLASSADGPNAARGAGEIA
jgi:hypothetical protein